jgi:EAL domain-containing protein (putative c-di-GMP-specific phosphodiesterase class I)
MYRAKKAGGGHELFVPEMYQALRERLSLEEELRHAVARDELRLVYQPILDLADQRIVGAEALLRWQHPERGLVSPATFIPVAEETGLIVPIGRWVLRQACREAAAWPRAAGADPTSLTVNISGRQLLDDALLDDIAAALRESGLDPHRLVLEITESVAMQGSAQNLERLHALKSLGVRLAIDDFGTGYSSLSYLQQFPIDVLKIDKAFIDGVARGLKDAALARTIIALGETLALRTIAEGIETSEQHARLHEFGCALGQGYLFARPMAPAALAERLAAEARPAGAAVAAGA